MWKNAGLGKTSKERFEGEYKHGKRDGQGYYVFPDGGRYIGTFKEDERHGFGTEIDSEGNIYEGQWRFSIKEDEGKAV
jgi:radial spoke head protein 1